MNGELFSFIDGSQGMSMAFSYILLLVVFKKNKKKTSMVNHIHNQNLPRSSRTIHPKLNIVIVCFSGGL